VIAHILALTRAHSGPTTPVLDLSLRPADGHGWPAYYDTVDAATDILAASLRGERPTPGRGCPCPARPLAGPGTGEVPA
jgi:uncharacterized protein